MKNANVREDFALWFRRGLISRGYDLGLRGGGRSRFAEDSGISPSTVGRLLKADDVSDIDVYTKIARAFGIPLGEILVRAGILTLADLTAAQTPHPTDHPMTPDAAADALGIEDPLDRELFRNTVETFRQRRRGRSQRANP